MLILSTQSIIFIMNQSFLLFQLQKIDTQLDQSRKRLSEIEKELANDARIFEAQNQVQIAQHTLDLAQKNLTQINDHVEAIKLKINTEEASLYSGKIQNPKELQDLQSEIISLRKNLTNLEEQMLEAMINFEEMENKRNDAKTSLEITRAKSIESKADLSGEKIVLEKLIDKFSTERAVATTSILPESLDLYNRLRVQKRGVAVTVVEDNTCTVCGVEIRPAEWQEARSPHKIICCSSCGRILYAG